ncbi:MAG: DUF4760 domain-containing protein [Frankiaceae bacterium]|nr:DUF4760 domain-containing protein [Frankiaceae bacterium]MBV9368453.1 DUF4760 domain-containing protein [Frankiales bacterium]
MTDTIPAQSTFTRPTDDLRIVTTPPSTADAQVILQLMQVNATTGADAGWHVLGEFETPPTRSQLLRKHPRESEEYRQIQAFLMSCETLATFVRQGILNEALVHDLYWITGAWRKTEKLCKAMRKEAGEPRIMENFEWLASRAT